MDCLRVDVQLFQQKMSEAQRLRAGDIDPAALSAQSDINQPQRGFPPLQRVLRGLTFVGALVTALEKEVEDHDGANLVLFATFFCRSTTHFAACKEYILPCSSFRRNLLELLP